LFACFHQVETAHWLLSYNLRFVHIVSLSA
jgi:hypothetical protein